MTKELMRLRDLLRQVNEAALRRKLPTGEREVDAEISKLRLRLSSGGGRGLQQNMVAEAVARFSADGRLASFRDAYLVSHGVLLTAEGGHPPVIEDLARFPLLLDGVSGYLDEPRRFRRCYQGLLHGYFGYDPEDAQRPAAGRQNWSRLQSFLGERVSFVLGDRQNPRWAECLQGHLNLFGTDPCGRYGDSLLAGQTAEVDELSQELRIADSSWFMRKLYLSQVRAILAKPDQQYLEQLPQLVGLLTDNAIILDEGLALTLDRHARTSPTPISPHLREMAARTWGNPWLPGNSTRWGRVGPEVRAMVTEWLKLEFIRDFFILLAENRNGDTRRLEYWERYVSAIGQIHFALGSQALLNPSRDYVAMRKRMEGLTIPLHDQVGSNNAFIMQIGSLVLVEFSGFSNACYGYETSKTLPFVLDGTPLTTPIDGPNSLKHARRALWLQHQDGIKGFETWEQRFEAALAEHGIHPQSGASMKSRRRAPNDRPTVQRAAAPTATTNAPQRPPTSPSSPTSAFFSLQTLREFARQEGLEVIDQRQKGGSLWVRADDSNPLISKTLRSWGFRYKDARKGWWLGA